jgi:hypothetical protein
MPDPNDHEVVVFRSLFVTLDHLTPITSCPSRAIERWLSSVRSFSLWIVLLYISQYQSHSQSNQSDEEEVVFRSLFITLDRLTSDVSR